jgi:hypothetical protein
VGGANVFQKEMEKGDGERRRRKWRKETKMEEETRSPIKWRMARDSPRSKESLLSSPESEESVVARGYTYKYLDIKYSAKIGRTEPGFWTRPLMEAI